MLSRIRQTHFLTVKGDTRAVLNDLTNHFQPVVLPIFRSLVEYPHDSTMAVQAQALKLVAIMFQQVSLIT